ncbi:TPA: TolC family protein [Klebsiella pneumoniae]|nr:TolC family protein [Klebsiella pneumoniae]
MATMHDLTRLGGRGPQLEACVMAAVLCVGSTETINATKCSLCASPAWKLDLWGRARATEDVTRDVEDALAALSSAQQRVDMPLQDTDVARIALQANEARYRAGAISLFELECSCLQLNSVQDSAISAASDRARSWGSLVRAAGNPPLSAAAPEPPAAQNMADTPIARNESNRR